MNVSINALDDASSLLWAGNHGGASQGFVYSPFGSTPARSAHNTVLPGFNGERLDPLSLNYHLGNGYRTYKPKLMRFNASDKWSPFGRGGLNQYGYCEGDPINRSDPSGHMRSGAIGGIFGAIFGVVGAGMAICTFGASLVVLGTAEVATASLVAEALASGFGVAAAGTGIASQATAKSNPSLSQALGWVSLGFGIVAFTTGVANLVHEKFMGRRTLVRLLPDGHEMQGVSDNLISQNPRSLTLPRTSSEGDIPYRLSHVNAPMASRDRFELRWGGMDDYYTDVDRADNELMACEGGVLYKRNDLPPRNGEYLYAFSPDEKMYLSEEANRDNVHSRMTAGGPVLSSGHLRIKSGLITYIDNNSGHYLVSAKNFSHAMRRALNKKFISLETNIHPFDTSLG